MSLFGAAIAFTKGGEWPGNARDRNDSPSGEVMYDSPN